MTNSIEPEYLRAGQRRNAGPHARETRRVGAAVIAALGLAAVGIPVGLGARRAQSDAPVDRRAHDKLVEQVRSLTTTVDALGQSALRLRVAADLLRSRSLTTDEDGVRSRLAAAEQASAAVAVAGPGVRVTLNDAAVPAGQEQDPAARLSDRDLQRVVNALWSSGAEAVAISGVRLTARSSIRTAGEAILVDFRPVTLPYRIEAIGEPGSLLRTFSATAQAAELRGLVASYGIRYDVQESSALTLPAGGGLEPRLASPLPSVGSGPTTIGPNGTLPETPTGSTAGQPFDSPGGSRP